MEFFPKWFMSPFKYQKIVYHLLHFLCRIKSIIRGRSGQNSAIASQVFIAAIINWFWVVSKVWGPKPSTTIQLERKKFLANSKHDLPFSSQHCSKIQYFVQKVAFNITSEASYVYICYILSGRKFIKNTKNSQFDDFLKTWSFSQTVLPDRSLWIGQKLVENVKLKNSNATFWAIFKHCGVGGILQILSKYTF